MSLKKLCTSPMGWNSFDCYGCTVYEEDVKANMDYMSAHLLQYGYEYIVVDNGWFTYYDLPAGQKYPAITAAERAADDICLDENGRVEPSEMFFPSGLKGMAEYAHSKGLKFGVHLMRGIPRKAVKNKCVIEGTNYTADQVANTASTCNWCNYNYGVDMSKPGAQEYYDSLIRKLAGWKLDFIKYDDITAFPDEVEAVVKAIRKTNYPMILSLSPGGDSTPENIGTYTKATALRVTADIWDNDRSIERSFAGLERYYTFAQKDFFVDLDMLCVGHLRLNVPPQVKKALVMRNAALAGEGEERLTRLTPAQQRSFITIRALAASPLMIGSDLPSMDSFTVELLTNKEMIYCNQITRSYEPLVNSEFTVWKSDAGFIGVFNRTDNSKTFSLATLAPYITTGTVLDVWNKHGLACDCAVDIPAQDVLFIKI